MFKRETMKTLIGFFIVLTGVALVTACGDKGGGGGNRPLCSGYYYNNYQGFYTDRSGNRVDCVTNANNNYYGNNSCGNGMVLIPDVTNGNSPMCARPCPDGMGGGQNPRDGLCYQQISNYCGSGNNTYYSPNGQNPYCQGNNFGYPQGGYPQQGYYPPYNNGYPPNY